MDSSVRPIIKDGSVIAVDQVLTLRGPGAVANAIKLRDNVAEMARRYPDYMLKATTWAGCYSDRAALLVKNQLYHMDSVELVLWRSDLINAAFHGCEPFRDEIVDETFVQRLNPQFWLFDDPLTFGWSDADSAVGKYWELPDDAELTAMFVGPSVGIDRVENRIAYFAPDGDHIWGLTAGFFFQSFKAPGFLIRFPPRLWVGQKAGCLFAWALAGIAFMQQPITVVRKERVSRQSSRQAARLGKPEPAVRVVHLRRELEEARESSAASPVNWTCQWFVQGHWRRLHEPRKIDGARITYVSEYVKGPPDKPLRLPVPTVTKVDR